jgi:hypothetical protein
VHQCRLARERVGVPSFCRLTWRLYHPIAKPTTSDAAVASAIRASAARPDAPARPAVAATSRWAALPRPRIERIAQRCVLLLQLGDAGGECCVARERLFHGGARQARAAVDVRMDVGVVMGRGFNGIASLHDLQ